MSDDRDKAGRKRMALMGISSLLLVAMVVALSVGSDNKKRVEEVSPSMRAVQAICQPTDFKEACITSLSSAAHNSTDPKELIKASFDVVIKEIDNVANNSTLFKELQKNPDTKKAADDCKELFQDAADDLRRSFDLVGEFDFNHADGILANLKTWLSATITYQETCLDGFENTTGDASERMRGLLENSMELSSNGLAIISELSSIISTMQISTFQRRRLLVTPDNRDDVLGNIDNLIKSRHLFAANGAHISEHQVHYHDDDDDDESSVIKRRRLLISSTNMVSYDGLPSWLDKPRRKLLQAAFPLEIEPNVTVAKDGSGDCNTIAEALDKIPKWNNDTFIIYVKEGVYYEYLKIDKWQTHVVLIGDGPTKTRISWNLNFIDGTPTFKTATLSVLASNFMAKDIGVENTAGASKHQAVAIRVQSDFSIFYNCHFDGYQDTLYAHTYRQFYRDCKISGTIDFVFGNAASFFQNCTFVVRRPLENQNCIVTAQGRKERHQPTGIIIHKSLFTADPQYYPYRFTNKAYLARPWKEYSKTVVMESYMEDLIQPEGWLPWWEDFGLDTCYYGEYNNAGPGANMTGRVKWRGVKTIIPSRAEKFMPSKFFGFDDWIRESGVPYIPNLTTAPAPEIAVLPDGTYDEEPNSPMTSPTDNPYESSSSASSKSEDHTSKSNDRDPKSAYNDQSILPQRSKPDQPIPQKSKSHSLKNRVPYISIALPPTISWAPAPSPSPTPSENPLNLFMGMGSTEEASQELQVMMLGRGRRANKKQHKMGLRRRKGTNGDKQPRKLIEDMERWLLEDGEEKDMDEPNDDMGGDGTFEDIPPPAYQNEDVLAPDPSNGLGEAPSSANGPSTNSSSGPSQAPMPIQGDDDMGDVFVPLPSYGPSGTTPESAREDTADAAVATPKPC